MLNLNRFICSHFNQAEKEDFFNDPKKNCHTRVNARIYLNDFTLREVWTYTLNRSHVAYAGLPPTVLPVVPVYVTVPVPNAAVPTITYATVPPWWSDLWISYTPISFVRRAEFNQLRNEFNQHRNEFNQFRVQILG